MEEIVEGSQMNALIYIHKDVFKNKYVNELKRFLLKLSNEQSFFFIIIGSGMDKQENIHKFNTENKFNIPIIAYQNNTKHSKPFLKYFSKYNIDFKNALLITSDVLETLFFSHHEMFNPESYEDLNIIFKNIMDYFRFRYDFIKCVKCNGKGFTLVYDQCGCEDYKSTCSYCDGAGYTSIIVK